MNGNLWSTDFSVQSQDQQSTIIFVSQSDEKKQTEPLTKKTTFSSLAVPLFITLLFFFAYTILSFVRHNNYQSFGYDLGINDQTVWRYSQFQLPLTTIDPFPDKLKLATHVELVYALIAPFYWIWNSRQMLLLLEPAYVCSAAIAFYLIARKRGLSAFVSNAILIGYLGFYGVQNALWFDVHSITFGAAFIGWFLYCIEVKRWKLSFLFFILAITAKENIGLITFFISLVYFFKEKKKLFIVYMILSILYVLFIFKVFFPHIMHIPYLYQNQGGLLSNLNPISFFDSKEKIVTLFYTFMSWGFLPFLSPLTLLPTIADFGTYFVLANELPGAQGTFGQYRVMLAPLLAWSTIWTVGRFKKQYLHILAILLLSSTILVQYLLHLPLSYLTKQWFWTEPSGVKFINEMKTTILPKNASVVAQNNIVPHISHRDKIYTLYPEKRKFEHDSPCGNIECNWFRWYDSPEYLFVDVSPEWDARHLFANREDYIEGLQNLEKEAIIQPYKEIGSARLYKVLKNPDSL